MNYQPIKKGCDRKSVPQVAKEYAFKEDLKTLVDVASANVLGGLPLKHGALLRKLLVCHSTQLPHTSRKNGKCILTEENLNRT